MSNLLDISHSLTANTDGHIIERSQDIPAAFLRNLHDKRNASSSVRESEMMHVASIPVVLVEKWIAEGFPFYQATAKEIVAKLKAESLEYFLATGKSI